MSKKNICVQDDDESWRSASRWNNAFVSQMHGRRNDIIARHSLLPVTTRSGQLPWNYPKNGNWRIVLADPTRKRFTDVRLGPRATRARSATEDLRHRRYEYDRVIDRGQWNRRLRHYHWASSGRGDLNGDGQQIRRIFTANYMEDRG